MYHIVSDPSEKLVRVELIGFPEQPGLDAFRNDLIGHIRRAKAGGASFNLLIDLRGASVLPQSHVGRVTDIVKSLVDQGLHSAAVLVASVLVKLQVSRLISGSIAHSFSDEGEALAWLASNRPS